MGYKDVVGLHSSDDYPELKSYDISQENIKCEECTEQLRNDMKTNSVIERNTPFGPVMEKN